MTNLHLIDPPKQAGMHAYTCARCTFEELKHPVFLSDGNAYGSQCAAIMLGLVAETATPAEVERALRGARAVKAAGDEQERATRRAEHDAIIARYDETIAPGGTHHDALAAAGGFAAWNVGFHTWADGQ